MRNQKPKLDEYKRWLDEERGIEITERTRAHYESVISRVKMDFDKSDFWVQLTNNIGEYNDEYLIRTGYPLLIPPFEPEVAIKPYDSFFLKTYRTNVLENRNWPDEPSIGWILPDNWFTKINDIVRTLFVVKYLDGVEFLKNKIESFCEQHNKPYSVSLEAREEGYYAAHLYTTHVSEIPKITWDTEKVDISIEIQITTQLQEVIRKLLHKYYEERRKRIKEEEPKWQWNYKSDEFVANYLGHILHYIEGMIMEIREKQKEGT